MYEVVIRKREKESVGPPMSWGDAFSSYEKQATLINAVNEKGEYLHPNTRVALREVPVP